MLTELLLNALAELATTALILTALAITCGAMLPPRNPKP